MDNRNKTIVPVTNQYGDFKSHTDDTKQIGLTKREYFAGIAMQGLLSCDATYNGVSDPNKLAIDAVRHADLLLEALEVTK